MIVLLVLLTAASLAQSAIINYAPPPIVGANVIYPVVSESSNTDPVPLYGAPTISGDVLSFRNMNFNANSIGGVPPIDLTDGQLNFTLVAKPGNFLSTLTLSEFGDYNVSNTPLNPAAIGFAKVYPQALQISVLEINGVPLGVPLVNNVSAVVNYAPSGGDFQTLVDPAVGSWTGIGVANLVSLFDSSKITKISVSFDNQLLAQSQPGAIASISKKGVDVVPGLVPEPASATLVVGGLFGLMLRRRRAAIVN